MAFDADADELLRWALPQRGLRWRGFRRNRRQVYRRLRDRIATLGLGDVAAYRDYLAAHPDEWPELEHLCRVTISRFARDWPMWRALVEHELPRRAWSAGCGAGEEPYTLVIACTLRGIAADILATDIDDNQLERARIGCYQTSTLRELPDEWRDAAFDVRGDEACLRDRFRTVRFAHHDLKSAPPPGPFDLVLCRNLAYSYFDEPAQRAVTARFRAALRPGGALVVGADERLPDGTPGFALRSHGIYIATESSITRMRSAAGSRGR